MWGPVDETKITNILDRPPKYAEKYIGQEASLIQKLYQMGVGPGDCVIDLGCCNGQLPLLTTYIFGSSAIGVDMETPREELCAENYVPDGIEQRFHRIEKNIQDDTLLSQILEYAKELGATKLFVVCKHLCGTGTDLCLELVDKLQQSNGVQVMGCIIATCCYHKILNDLETYQRLHDINHPHLDQLTKWTAWNATTQSLNNKVTKNQVTYAVALEDMIQAPRIRYMKKLFPHAQEILFCETSASPHNRCLIGSNSLTLEGAWATKGVPRALEELGQIWKFWPKNIVSKRFDVDMTKPEK